MKLKAYFLLPQSVIPQGAPMVATILIALGGVANAVVQTWDGRSNPLNSLWSTNRNWGNGQGQGTPVNGDSVTFAGTNNISTSNDITNLSLVGISFSNTAGAFTLAGNALTLASGGITNGSASSQTITLASITLGSAQVFDAGVGAGGIAMSSNVTNGGFGLSWTGASSSNFSGIMSGTGGLTKLGTGTLTLSGANTYTGATLVNAGTLALGANDRLANAATLTVAGGISNTATFTDTIGAFNMSSGSITGTGTITAATYGLSGGTVAANLGAGTTTVTGGTTTLNGTSASANISINSGTLALGASNRLADAATLTVAGGVLNAGAFSDTIGVFNMSSGSITGTGTITAATYGLSGGVVTANLGAGTTTVTGGTTTLNGTSASSNISINSGTLALGASNRLADAAALTVASGASWNLNNNVETLASITGAGGINLGTSGAGRLTVGAGNFSSTFSGVISGDGSTTGGFVKTGTGVVALTGANTFLGNIRVENGTLSINTVGSLEVPQSLGQGVQGSVYLGENGGTGGTLRYTGGAGDLHQNIFVLGQNSVLENAGTGLLNVRSTIQVSSGSLTIAGGVSGIQVNAAILGASSLVSTTGYVSLSGGYLSAAAALDVQGTIALGSGNQGVTQLVAGLVGIGSIVGNSPDISYVGVSHNGVSKEFFGVIGGGGPNQNNIGFLKTGSGTQVLSGSSSNTYTGLTNVDGGTLRLSKSSGNAIGGDLHIDSGNVEIASSEQISNSSNVSIMGGAITFTGSGLSETIGTFENTGGTFSTGANTLIGTGNSIYFSGGTNTINSGGLVQDAHYVISGGSNTLEPGGVLELASGGTGLEFIGSASPSLVLQSSNTTAGKLLLKGNVISNVTTGTALISSSGSGSNAGIVDLNGGIRSFEVANGSAGTDLRITASVSNGGLTKTGAGTLDLAGTNTYAGATTIASGKLVVNGSTSASSAVGVSSGGTLAGSGVVGGSVNIANGGILAPGNSPGILTVSGGATFSSGSIFEWEMDTSKPNPTTNRGTAYDGVNAASVSGSGAIFKILLTGTQDFDDAFWSQTRTWTDIFKSVDGSTNLADWASVFGGGFQYSYNGQTITPATEGSFSLSGNSLTWSAVPEPGNLLVGLLLAGGLLRRRRR